MSEAKRPSAGVILARVRQHIQRTHRAYVGSERFIAGKVELPMGDVDEATLGAAVAKAVGNFVAAHPIAPGETAGATTRHSVGIASRTF